MAQSVRENEKAVNAQIAGVVVGQVQHQPALRRGLHLRSDLRGAGAQEHHPEIAKMECLKSPPQEALRGLLGGRFRLFDGVGQGIYSAP